MLTTLRIKNLALVEDLTLELPPGCVAISGETGAGKSIIIGALNLVLGERADRTLIRGGSDSCSVEAVFETSRLRAPLKAFLEENGLEPCEAGQLVLKRTFTTAGTNKQFINGSPTTLAVLAQIGEWLVDVHGPHDHQSLLQQPKQLAILDAFGGLLPLREQFAGLVRRRAALESEKSALIVDEQTYSRELDLLRHQVREITEARLQPDEEEQVEQEYRRTANAARLMELGQAALNVLTESETSVMTQAGTLGRLLQEIQRTDESARCLHSLHEQAVAALRDVQSDLSHYVDKLDLDPQRLQQVEERLNLIQSLKRKYGSTLADVIESGEQAQRKLRQLESRDAELARLNVELAKSDADLQRIGAQLTKERRAVIPRLTKAAAKQLADLGFQRCRFDIELATALPSGSGNLKSEIRNPQSSGCDTVEFQFAPNPGEPARPLRAIASSGEMARVMLALKTVLATEDEIPVLIFDEVDANVGGETANAVGEKMRQIAKQRQVLCITHLAPVAACADSHFVVTKQVKSGRTISEITRIEAKDRVTELARMLGGQTEAARRHAQAMLRAVLALMLAVGVMLGCKSTSRSAFTVEQIKATMADTNQTERMETELAVLGASSKGPGLAYDTRMMWGIQRRWHDLIRQSHHFPTSEAAIVIEFTLHDDGSVTELTVTEPGNDKMLGLFARMSIERLAPFPPWPNEMKQLIGKDCRDIRFTFNCHPDASNDHPRTLEGARKATKSQR